MASTYSNPIRSFVKTVRPVYAIFEGGGARGITHVGALKALENEGFALVGAAGASAGAIIAALVAVGYTADELFDGTRDILGDLGLAPVDLIGRGNWSKLVQFRRSVKCLAWSVVITIIATLLVIYAQSTAIAFISKCILGLAIACGFFLLVSLFWIPWQIWHHNGLFTTTKLRETLNTLLREKLKLHYREMGRAEEDVPDLIRFAHLDPTKVSGCCRLKIVVTDSISGQMVLFDHNTESVVVAEAVAASAAIPFVFAPPAVSELDSGRKWRLVDGGLVSNLPAWAFRTEKRALEREQGGPPIPIFAFTLAAHKAAQEGEVGLIGAFSRFREIWAFLKDVVMTGIFGSQAVVQDFIDELAVFSLPSPLSTLSLDCTREEAVAAYKSGLETAGQALSMRRRTEALTQAILEAVLADVAAEIGQRRASAGVTFPNLRLSIVDPLDARQSAFRVTASANMDADSDDRLELDLRNDLAPRCYFSRVPVFGNVKGRNAQALWMTKYERALVHPGIHSVICVPVFGETINEGTLRPAAQRVLCVDSSDLLELEFNDPMFMQLLVGLSESASPSLIAAQVKGTVHEQQHYV